MIIETIIALEIAAATLYLGRKLDKRKDALPPQEHYVSVSHHSPDEIQVKNDHGETVFRRPKGHPDLRELEAHGGFTFHDIDGNRLEGSNR